MEQPIVNVEQAAAWDGAEGAVWAADWEIFDRSLREYRHHMSEVAAIRDGEQVLDVGCGNGQSTRDAARATPSGSVLGIDLSSAMLDRARELARAEGLQNVEFVQGDAQVHQFDEAGFDVATSRFGSMFFVDKAVAFANIARALRPGGRLLLVVWQPISENEQFITMRGSLAAGRDLPQPPPGAPSPFGLADPELGRRWLVAAGFTDVAYESVARPFYLAQNSDEAFALACRNPMVRGLVADLDEATRTEALETLRRAIQAHETDDGVEFRSATWFITARRP